VSVRIVAAHSLREALRRRVFLVVLILSCTFLALYGWGVSELFNDTETLGGESGVEVDPLAGATILGLAMFTILFLGVVLTTFLTLSAVRGDAERGLLQPLIVRPLGRNAYLGGRLLAASAVSGTYVVLLFGACIVVTGLLGWWPDRVIAPMLALVGAVVVISALALLGSVLLSTTANGIAVFMVFGAGMAAGLLGQIGEALGSDTLDTLSDIGEWLLPFQALYQEGLAALTADIEGPTRVLVELGPFGGAEERGAILWPYAAAYAAALTVAAALAFARRDL
jgi:ABC-type transport system involved in multi-copper enzyme maturation permease subunit